MNISTRHLAYERQQNAEAVLRSFPSSYDKPRASVQVWRIIDLIRKANRESEKRANDLLALVANDE